MITDATFCSLSWWKILQTCIFFQKAFIFLFKINQVVISHNQIPCIPKQKPCMSCFSCIASGVLQLPKIYKNVQNIWWKVVLVPWGNFTTHLSLLSPLFLFFLSFRWHVIVSPSVTESCKRLELGCILGNTHTHTHIDKRAMCEAYTSKKHH